MKFSETISEEEAIELHLAGELSNQDPKLILKTVGILGAQNIICESFIQAKEKGDFSYIRSSLSKVFSGFHVMKTGDMGLELKSANQEIEELKSKISSVESGSVYRMYNYMFAAFVGFLFALIALS